MTFEQALITAVIALGGCVAALFGCVTALFRWFQGQFNKVLAKLEECEDDREALWARVADMAAGRTPDEHGDEPTRVYPAREGGRHKQNKRDHRHEH